MNIMQIIDSLKLAQSGWKEEPELPLVYNMILFK